MNPDVVSAIDALAQAGTLSPRTAVPLRRAASGELISLHTGLSFLLWAGVLLVTGGVGILVEQNLDRIGPVAIALVLGAAAAACWIWAWRRSAPSSFAFESVLLLGALLAAADLAFIEVKFTALGPQWPWHLFIVAIGYAALAIRFDSTSLFSLALTSFAAWRGVSIAVAATPWRGPAQPDRFFLEALGCGLLFLAIGKLAEAAPFHPRFEPAAAWLGWGLVFFSLAMGPGGRVAMTMLVFTGVLLAFFAWEERRVGRYALGMGAAAVGVGEWVADLLDRVHADTAVWFAAFVILGIAVIVLIVRAQRSLKGPA